MPERDARPSAHQERLLHAALAGGEAALAAWRDFRAGGGKLDEGASRLLALVGDNLARAGADSSEIAPMRALHRRTLVANELLFRRMAPVVAALEEEGIETVLLKGASLALRRYRDPGLRPMSDIDLLVPPQKAALAISRLEAAGFASATAFDERRREVLHAGDFSDAAGRHLDLHWRLFPHRYELDPSLWERVEAMELAGVPTRALGAADELLHTFVHGLHWSPTPPLRWVADAMAILGGGAAALDWDAFVEAARRQRLVLAAREGLDYCRRRFGAEVPPAVLDALDRSPVSVAERIEYRVGLRRETYTVFGGLPVFAFLYLGLARRRGERPGAAGFARYLAEYFAADSVAAVLRRFLRRAAARAWSVASGRPLPPP